MVLFERKNAFLYMILEWKRFILHHEGRPLLRSHVGECQRFDTPQYDVKKCQSFAETRPRKWRSDRCRDEIVHFLKKLLTGNLINWQFLTLKIWQNVNPILVF